MAEFIAPSIQAVDVGGNVTYTDEIVGGCDLITHRSGSGSVKVYPINGKCYTRFFVAFSGNIAVPEDATPGPIQLSISIDGEPSTATAMMVTSSLTNRYFNVAGFTYIYIKKCCSTVSVTNTSTIPINVQNANLIVKKA